MTYVVQPPLYAAITQQTHVPFQVLRNVCTFPKHFLSNLLVVIYSRKETTKVLIFHISTFLTGMHIDATELLPMLLLKLEDDE